MILIEKLKKNPNLCLIFHFFENPRGGMLDNVAIAENLKMAKLGAESVPGWVQILDFSTDILNLRDPEGVWIEEPPDTTTPIGAVLLANKNFPRTNKQTQHDR